MADPSRDVILEAIHFRMEIGNPCHARLSGMLSIRSYGPPAETCPQGHYAAFVVLQLTAITWKLSFHGVRCPLMADFVAKGG